MKKKLGFCLLVFYVFLGFCRLGLAATGQPNDANQYYLKGLLFEAKGNYQEALVEIKRAMELAPASPYLHKTAAELYLKLGDIAKASQQIEEALRLAPEDEKNLTLAGQISWAIGDTSKAIPLLEKAVKLNPDQTGALMSLAGALTPTKPKEAIKLYQDYLSRHPSEIAVRERIAQIYQGIGDEVNSKKAWESLLEWSPHSLRAHLALAQMAEVNLDTATAISHYQNILTQDPNNLALLLRVGELRYRSNEMLEAEEAFIKVKTISPNSTAANFWLALLAENKGEWNQAIKLLEDVNKKEKDPGVSLRLSYYYSQAKRPKDAIRVLSDLSKSEPENLDFLNYLAAAYELDGQFNLAEKTLVQILDINPSDVEARFELATVYDHLKQFTKAEEQLKESIRLKPDFHMALNYLGYSYADRNMNLSQARDLISKALELSPENAAYLDSMGWVYFRLNQYELSIKALEKSLSLDHDPLIFDHLGDVFWADQKRSKALLAWDESVKLDPTRKSVFRKIQKAFKEISVEQKASLFLERASFHFQNFSVINSFVSIKVCEGGPCFTTKAQFSYLKGQESRMEIPGPMGAPVMLLVKKADQSTEFGAVHPVFKQAEDDVISAYTKIISIFDSSVFTRDKKMINVESFKTKGGKLFVQVKGIYFQFREKDGALEKISWLYDSGVETVSISNYSIYQAKNLPESFEWNKNKFALNLKFISPVFSFQPLKLENRNRK
ncbi:MAG: tetratricopeptide repeat protein [Elusimicrobiota bacterium]